MSKDYYIILEITNKATDDDIKKSYRRLAKMHHPDAGGNSEKFKEIAEAYEVLSDPNKRRQHDSSHINNYNRSSYSHSTEFNFEDIFGDFDINSVFGNRTYNTNTYTQRKYKGESLRIVLAITLDEILNGCNKKIKISRKVKCNSCSGKGGSGESTCVTCNGRGQVNQRQQTVLGMLSQTVVCPTCVGSGKSHKISCTSCNSNGVVMQEEIIEIAIPKGVSGGIPMTKNGYGNYIKNGEYGDLVIVIEEVEHNKYKRDKNNLHTTVLLTIVDAILGVKLELSLLDNTKVILDIPKGTSDGYTLRFPKKGITDVYNSHIIGDLIVMIKIKMPTNLSDDEIKIVKQLQQLPSFR